MIDKERDLDYLKKFWVGLMDGEGSIQVNHWRKKNLQYRLVIKLKYCSENFSMLNLIKEDIGGIVKIIKKGDFVIWVSDNKKSIIKIISIFKKYPPLTFRLQAQLSFLDKCLEDNDVVKYLANRSNKYSFFPREYIETSTYFTSWLSGFIEAEGCFSIRKNNKIKSFSIGQKNDLYVIEKIHKYFELTCKIRSLKNKDSIFYSFETYNKIAAFRIIKHLDKYPLLGEKLLSYTKFKTLY
jgi:hypothetical protein